MRLFVYDDAGLLIGIRSDPSVPFLDDNIWWSEVPDEPDSLVLGWIGRICADPTLRISQEGGVATLAVFEGVLEGVEGEACPAVGVAHKVVLTFNVPVSDLVISLRLSE